MLIQKRLIQAISVAGCMGSIMAVMPGFTAFFIIAMMLSFSIQE